MRPAAVLFDCDGVLADTESLLHQVVAADMVARGWRFSVEDSARLAMGFSLPAMQQVLEQHFGALPPDWVPQQQASIIAAVQRQMNAIDGAVDLVHRIAATRIRLAVCSNAGRPELLAKLRRLELEAVFAPRIFSFEDVARPKPHPDIYLAAAAACGADPADCVVVEDSLVGAQAGIAAGCRVLGLLHDTDASVFRAIGAEPLAHMDALPALLGLR